MSGSYNGRGYSSAVSDNLLREIQRAERLGIERGEAAVVVSLFTIGPAFGLLAAALGKKRPTEAEVVELAKKAIDLVAQLPDK